MMALVNQRRHTDQPIRAAFAEHSAASQPQQCFIPRAFSSRLPAIDENDVIKSKIISHVQYPHLVNAYIECQKGGQRYTSFVGMDPQFDYFMEPIAKC